MVIGWPVAERVSSDSGRITSRRFSTTFSMPVTAMYSAAPWSTCGRCPRFHQQQRAGLGDREVNRDADVGLEEVAPQGLAADLDEAIDVLGILDRELVVEQLRDLACVGGSP